jgi:hypothetical protein
MVLIGIEDDIAVALSQVPSVVSDVSQTVVGEPNFARRRGQRQ